MRALASVLVAAALATGCAPATRVILLPQDGGRAGSVAVSAAAGTQVLDQPFQNADVGARGDLSVGQTTAEKVQKDYGPLLALRPPAPERFVLNFQPGGAALTAESESLLPQVLAAAAARKGGEIVVIGHTDTVGAGDANDALSLRRAQAIRELLVGRGFRAELIEAVGRGEREPLVPTADDVDEPRNRRAEVLVR